MSLSRQKNNGLKWGKLGTWKPNKLTNTQQGKGLESQSCQLLDQEGMMQGFTATLKVTEPGVIFGWVSLGSAAVIFMSDQQFLFQLGQCWRNSSHVHHTTRSLNSLCCLKLTPSCAGSSTCPLPCPSTCWSAVPSHLSASVGLNQTLVILNRSLLYLIHYKIWKNCRKAADSNQSISTKY